MREELTSSACPKEPRIWAWGCFFCFYSFKACNKPGLFSYFLSTLSGGDESLLRVGGTPPVDLSTSLHHVAIQKNYRKNCFLLTLNITRLRKAVLSLKLLLHLFLPALVGIFCRLHSLPTDISSHSEFQFCDLRKILNVPKDYNG